MRDKIIEFFKTLSSNTWATSNQIYGAISKTDYTFCVNLDYLVKNQILSRNYSPKDKEIYYAWNHSLPYSTRVLCELLDYDGYKSAKYLAEKLKFDVKTGLNILCECNLVVCHTNSLGEKTYKAKTKELIRTVYEPPESKWEIAEKNYNELAAKHDHLKCENDRLKYENDELKALQKKAMEEDECIVTAEQKPKSDPQTDPQIEIGEKITKFLKNLTSSTWVTKAQISKAMNISELDQISLALEPLIQKKAVIKHFSWKDHKAYFTLSSKLITRDRVFVELVNHIVAHRDDPCLNNRSLSLDKISKLSGLNESLVQQCLDGLLKLDLIRTMQVVFDHKGSEITHYQAQEEEFEKIVYQTLPYKIIEKQAEYMENRFQTILSKDKVIADKDKLIKTQQKELEIAKLVFDNQKKEVEPELSLKNYKLKDTKIPGNLEEVVRIHQVESHDAIAVLNYLVDEKKKGYPGGYSCGGIASFTGMSQARVKQAMDELVDMDLVKKFTSPSGVDLFVAESEVITLAYNPDKVYREIILNRLIEYKRIFHTSENGSGWLGLSNMAARAGLDQRRVKEVLKGLLKEGLIETAELDDGGCGLVYAATEEIAGVEIRPSEKGCVRFTDNMFVDLTLVKQETRTKNASKDIKEAVENLGREIDKAMEKLLPMDQVISIKKKKEPRFTWLKRIFTT